MIQEDDLNILYRYAISLTGNDDQAYDLVHEAILKSRKYLVIHQKSYLKKCIRNLFFDQIKFDRKHDSMEQSDKSFGEADHSFEERAQQKNQLEQHLRLLEPAEREILYLFYVEGFSYREIAKLTALKLGTVMSKLSRCKEKMRRSYE